MDSVPTLRAGGSYPAIRLNQILKLIQAYPISVNLGYTFFVS